MHGESAVAELHTRPDYAISVRHAAGRVYRVESARQGRRSPQVQDRHDKAQWEKLQSLPNLIYTDGNEFSLWQNGEHRRIGSPLDGRRGVIGRQARIAPALLAMFEGFLRWEPVPPRNAKQLARVAARLCRLLRDEVAEQLTLGSRALTSLATDWRKLLFPEASDRQFADGYAQAVTFGVLMARAREIELGTGLNQVAAQLRQTNSLIGSASPAYRRCREPGNLKTRWARSCACWTRSTGPISAKAMPMRGSTSTKTFLGLRQRLAEVDRLLLHAPGSR